MHATPGAVKMNTEAATQTFLGVCWNRRTCAGHTGRVVRNSWLLTGSKVGIHGAARGRLGGPGGPGVGARGGAAARESCPRRWVIFMFSLCPPISPSYITLHRNCKHFECRAVACEVQLVSVFKTCNSTADGSDVTAEAQWHLTRRQFRSSPTPAVSTPCTHLYLRDIAFSAPPTPL